MRQEQPFKRVKQNPIVTTADVPVPCMAVLNPGAAEQDGQTVLLVRVETPEGFSDIHAARSANGVTDWQIDREPILKHGLADCRYESWGCEDARIARVGEDDCWYITYVAYSETGPAVAIASSADLRVAQRVSLLGATNDKDGVLMPAKFDGEYAILHRPDAGGYQHIWSAYSRDLVHWGKPHCVLREDPGPAWNTVRVGAGPPPILTQGGWLLIYHGVKFYGGQPVYRAGLAMLDKDRPHKLIARSRGSVFAPEAPYETTGMVGNVIFPTGAMLRDDEVWMYYGAADKCIALATAKLAHLLSLLEPVAGDP